MTADKDLVSVLDPVCLNWCLPLRRRQDIGGSNSTKRECVASMVCTRSRFLTFSPWCETHPTHQRTA